MMNEQEVKREPSKYCQVCGHDAHESGKCSYYNVVAGCICGSCWGYCTCDGTSYDVTDATVKDEKGILQAKKGGPFTKPGTWAGQNGRWM